jgi:hypothetical protein
LVVFSFHRAWEVSNSFFASCCRWISDFNFNALVPCSSTPPET